MSPPRVRLPLVGVSMLSLTLQFMLRLTVWVTARLVRAETNAPLKLMSLPPIVNAPPPHRK